MSNSYNWVRKRIVLLIFCLMFCFTFSIVFFGNSLPLFSQKPDIGILPLYLCAEYSHPTSTIIQVVESGNDKYLLTKNSIEKIDDHRNVKWKYDAIESWMVIEKLLIDSNYLYFDNSRTTIALDKDTGNTIWVRDHIDNVTTSTKILGEYGDFIFVEVFNYGMYVLDKNDGEIQWSYHYFRSYADIFFFNDRVISFLRDKILVFNIYTGDVLDEKRISLSYTATLSKDLLYYVQKIDDSLWELETYDIKTFNTEKILRIDKKTTCLDVVDENIFLVAEDSIYKTDDNGNVVWKTKFHAGNCNSIIVSKNLLLFSDAYNQVHGVNSDTGEMYGSIKNYKIKTSLKENIYIDESAKINIFLLFDHNFYQYKVIE